MLRLFIEPEIKPLVSTIKRALIRRKTAFKRHTGNVSGEISQMDVKLREEPHNYHYTNPARQFHFHVAAALCIARCQMMHVCGFTLIIKKKLRAHASLQKSTSAHLKFVNLPCEHKEKLRPFCI
jgi:hypothetical protein